ncbi:uncharacterized protein LOC117826748 [Notolabrus celidotus]|uniref:uncharacterized protein LOC117826748 n=1 Tax=Notolabrus celidotus TaxID=1203425 RepID=UPI0014905CD2|nr:uncharacterized protein LOC117826748 [Notolabrus celidotus]
MNPQNNNVPLQPSATMPSKRQRKRNQQNRIPFGYKEAMKFISVKLSHYTKRMQSDIEQEEETSEGPTDFKWRSSFKAVDKSEEGPSVENTAASANRDELYNPFEPASSDSEPEIPQHEEQNQSNPVQDLESQSLSPNQSCSEQSHWDSSVLRPGSRPLDSLDFENQGLSPGHRLTDQGDYSPETELLNQAGFDPISRPVDHQVCSPERVIPSSSTQLFPPSYGGQRTNGEGRMAVPEYRREVSPLRQMTTVRLSPPRLKRDYPQHLGYNETELDQIPPPNKVTRLCGKNVIMDKTPIYCDLCDVELANGQELEDHLESKGHWGTMEHIQQHNNYDDVILAFLQDFMMYKSHQCSRAIEDCALPALQENDHMTKIELFNCAACKVFVSTSAASVQTHITSQEHLDNTKEFESQQRRVCLDKAETMMNELKPQFEHFLKGGSTSE